MPSRTVSPSAGGRRVFVLSAEAVGLPGVGRDTDWGLPVYRGVRLPGFLERSASVPYSLERLAEDLLNRSPAAPVVVAGGAGPVARPHQVPLIEQVTAAYRAGAPGFLLVLPTGAGKTAVVLMALDLLPVERVLVVAPLTMVAVWQRAIGAFTRGGVRRWAVVHPERLWRLFGHPQVDMGRLPAHEVGGFAAEWGVGRVVWDAVVVDESQIAADPASLRSRLLHRLVHRAGGPDAFFVPMSATPFSTLAETAYCADLIAHAARAALPRVREGEGYLGWLEGLRLGAGRGGVDATVRVKELLYRGGVGASASQGDLGLPPQRRELHPVRLTVGERARYERSWSEFRRVYGLTPDADAVGGVDGAGGMEGEERAAALRRVQKASLLKVPYVAAHVAGLVARGFQVIVPAWFLENVQALAVAIARVLRERGLPDRVVAITGQDPGLRERKRAAFQTGRALVVVTNVVQGMNLHAGEADADGAGRPATPAPRITVVADVLTGGKRLLQAEGRGQRDGREAAAHYLVAEGTTEARWLAGALRAVAGTQDLARSPEEAAGVLTLAALVDDLGGGS